MGRHESTVIGFLVASVLVASTADAKPPRGEVSALVGWGSAAFDDWEGNNFGPMLGVRAGLDVGRLWLGFVPTFYFGGADETQDIDTTGKEVNGHYSLAVFAPGGEIGCNFGIGRVTLRPYMWAGAFLYFQSPLSDFTPATAKGFPFVRFTVAPSMHVDYELPQSGLFFGADVRVNLLVPGKIPQVPYDGGSYAPAGWAYQGHESFTGELSLFLSFGKRF